MKLHQAHVAIAQTPAPVVQPGAVQIPLEVIIFGGMGLLLAAGKWLLGRELQRLDKALEEFDARLDRLESTQVNQQVDKVALDRLEKEVAALELATSQALAGVAGLPEIKAQQERFAQGTGELREKVQRLDNVGYALTSTQDLIKALQKDLLTFKAEVAAGFVAEEKFVRDMTVLTTRIDAVWERIDQATGGRQRLIEGGR